LDECTGLRSTEEEDSMSEVHLRTTDGRGHEPAPLVLTAFPCVLGRARACAVRLDHPAVSRQHCCFAAKDGAIWVEDLDSLNGTGINGEPLKGGRPLRDGDRLDLPHQTFVVRLVAAAPLGVEPTTFAKDQSDPAR
jgi:pSer/pThr/pTyr-binding forkhead associated (FHA) protein